MSDSPEGRKPLLESRGVLRLDDFARAAGVDAAGVEELLRSEEIEGLFDLDDRPFGVFADVLPSAERLRELGLVPDPAYRPEALQGTDVHVDDDESEEPSSSSPDRFMTWGPQPPAEG